jgi:hypothetical protein
MENRYRWPTNPMSTSDEAQAMMRIERNLSDDNDRLRAALTLIAGAKDVRGCDEIARQALAGSPVETCIGSQQETKAFTPDEHSPACATRRFGEKECDCGVAEKTDLVNQLKAKGDQTTPRIDRQVCGAAGEDS